MNAIQLAKDAEAAARPFVGILADEMLVNVKLAHVAKWLSAQDETTSASVLLARAQEAIHAIHAGEFA